MKSFEFEVRRSYLLRLDYGRDLLEQLEEFLKAKRIYAAYVSGVGAVRSAEIGYYDQEKRTYVKKEINRPLEILNLSGNVSLKDEEPFLHLHIILGKDGEVYGGHLFRAEVFACEVFLIVLEGEIPKRGPDHQTGLHLWI